MRLLKCVPALAIVFGMTFGVKTDPVAAETVTVPATATIVDSVLTLTKDTDLDMGSIIADSTGGCTITLDATAGATNPLVTAGDCSVSSGFSGQVTVGTNLDANVTISYAVAGDPSAVANELETADAANTMAFTAADITANSTATNLAITTAGPNVIHVGGVLTVGTAQVAGVYTGDVTVTVIY